MGSLSKKFLAVLLMTLMISGCASVNTGHAEIYFNQRTVKHQILIDGETYAEISPAQNSAMVAVNIPKGEHQLTIVNNSNILLDTTLVIGNDHNRNKWLEWSIGTTGLLGSITFGGVGWIVGLFLFAVPHLLDQSFNEADAILNIAAITPPDIEEFYSDSIYANITFNSVTNRKFFFKPEALCYDEPTNLIWIKTYYSNLSYYDLEMVSLCTSQESDIQCKTPDKKFWQDFQCRPKPE